MSKKTGALTLFFKKKGQSLFLYFSQNSEMSENNHCTNFIHRIGHYYGL